MKYLLRPVSLLIGGALVVFLAVWGFGRYTDWRARDAAEWKTKLKQADDSVKFYRETSKRDSIEYRDVIVPKYITLRDQTIRDPATTDATKNVIKACDLIVSTCDSIQGNLRGQIRGLESENNLLRHKPGPARAVAYGSALYDFVGMRPVFRVGGNVKILGPINARVEGEYAIPSAIKTNVGDGFRVLVGGQINFNR